jgi:hypothetical protein
MNHTILYIRKESLNITNAAICTFSANTQNPQETLQNAITQWVKETRVGKQQYIQSSKTFNIGDLACCQNPQMFKEYGIKNLNIQTLEPEEINLFDKKLYKEEF